MEAQKAVEELRIKHCIKNQNCTDSCQHGENICPYDMAINALEKQIPKKVLIGDCGYSLYGCPNCDHTDDLWSLGKHDKHCPNCGQKLDWSEV